MMKITERRGSAKGLVMEKAPRHGAVREVITGGLLDLSASGGIGSQLMSLIRGREAGFGIGDECGLGL